jgi:GntR family transcriptional regulator, rspAB operon transcriptional repressor
MKPTYQHAKIKGLAAPRLPGSEPKLLLTERVYAALKKDIIVGVLRPGQAFTEKELAHRYVASRTPVREAAVRLQEEDLVRIIANRGYFVTQLTIQGMNDMYEFRAAIESACAELLCGAKIPPQARAELESAAQFRADNEGKFGAFIEADTAFHLGIARLTHNALLVRAVAQMRAQTERILFAAAEAIELPYYGEIPAREHMAILRAISRDDPELARRLMREHIIGGKNKVLDLARRDIRFL